jgi:hypothetical protein
VDGDLVAEAVKLSRCVHFTYHYWKDASILCASDGGMSGTKESHVWRIVREVRVKVRELCSIVSERGYRGAIEDCGYDYISSDINPRKVLNIALHEEKAGDVSDGKENL